MCSSAKLPVGERTIRRHCASTSQNEVDFILPEPEVPFQNGALLELFNWQPFCFIGKLVSAQV